MSSKPQKYHLYTKVSALILQLSEGNHASLEASAELERIFGRTLASAIELVLEEERVTCDACRRDEAASAMSSNGKCFLCEREARNGHFAR